MNPSVRIWSSRYGVRRPTSEDPRVKVFISSGRYLLRDERDNLPPFLRVLDHEPLRFEGFTSQDASSRAACLAGVNAADVYVLLLGPKYGDPFADTGLSPTAEGFAVARTASPGVGGLRLGPGP